MTRAMVPTSIGTETASDASGTDRSGDPARGDGRCRGRAEVARIIDGDTIELTSGERIRVLNVDTPELHGARCNREFAMAMWAKERLEGLVAAGQPIAVSRRGFDRYRRALAVVTIGGEDVAVLLIREGLALPYRPRQSREKPGPWC